MTKTAIPGFICLVFALLSFPAVNFGQISHGGKPVDETLFPVHEIVFESMPAFDLPAQVKTESDFENSFRLKPLHYAHTFPVGFGPENSGVWKNIPGIGRIWKLGIYSSGAYSLNLIFDQFELKEGVKVFLYNPDKTFVLGSFDHRNAPEGILAVSPVPGEELIIEMIVPSSIDQYGSLRLGSVNHDFTGILGFRQGQAGESGKCNVDINCPEGNNLQLEKHSVVRLLITRTGGSFVCTGTLVNNTSQDGKPYVLTANHCIDKQSEASTLVVLFGYEASSCNGSVLTGSSLTGSTLRATRENVDMTLLEMNQMPPAALKPYYMGWNRVDQAASKTATLHHPNGDLKKIALDNDPSVSTTVSGYINQGHWRINRWDLGTTESGSSGASLLDQNGRVVGFLTGGFAVCGNPVNDYFAKFAKAWDTGITDAENLKPWLDPANTGATALNGMNPYKNNILEADFALNSIFVCKDEFFVFTDFSRGNVNSWSWNFGTGASPASAPGKGPHLVSYSSGGDKTISLTVEDGIGGSNQKQQNINLQIKSTDLPVADFSAQVNLRQVTFTNLSLNGVTYYWDFGDNTISTLTSPGTRTYATNGDYEVNLLVRNGPCESKKKELLLKVFTEKTNPGITEILVYPNPAPGVFTILSPDDGLARNYELIETTGKTVLSGIFQGDFHQVDAAHLPPGIYLLRIRDRLNVQSSRLIIQK